MPELPVVSQPVHRCAALLDHLSRRTRALGEEVLEPLGLRPRHLLTLTILRDHGGSQQALAEVLHIDRTNLVGLLNELEDNGLIERRRSPEDRRRHVVELTTAGHETLARAEMALAAAEDVVFGALSTGERERLYQLLQKASSGLTLDAALDSIDRGGQGSCC
jgi:MarR family transcriptional regulator, lower aerobic nicotinate degradation pathway regulator